MGKEEEEPNLEELLEQLKDDDWITRRSACEALENTRDSRMVEPLMIALKRSLVKEDLHMVDLLSYRSQKYKILEMLSRLGESVVGPLIQALKNMDFDDLDDEDVKIRYKVVEILVEHGDKRVIEPLIELLNDPLVREKVIEGLVKYGTQEFSLLLSALDDEDYLVRSGVAVVLGKIGDIRALEPLINLLHDTNYIVRGDAAEALGKLRDEQAVLPLVEALKEEDKKVEEEAKIRLEERKSNNEFGTEYTQRSFLALQRQIMKESKVKIIRALIKFNDERIKEPFEKLLEEEKRRKEEIQITIDPSQRVQLQKNLFPGNLESDIRRTLWKIDWKLERSTGEEDDKLVQNRKKLKLMESNLVLKDSVALLIQDEDFSSEKLLELLKDEDKYVRRSAAIVLGILGDPKSVIPLLSLLQDKYGSVRDTAVRSLEEIGDEGAVDSLEELLKRETSTDSRVLIKEAIRKIKGGLPSGYKQLVEKLSDNDPKIRQYAIKELRNLRDQRPVIDHIVNASFDENWKVRKTAVDALGWLTDPCVVEPILLALQDEEEDVRQTAIRALFRPGDPRVVDPLIQTLFNENRSYIKESVIEFLGMLGDVKVVEPLIKLLLDKNEHYTVKISAASVLGELGDERALEPLSQAEQEDQYSKVRYHAGNALYKLQRKLDDKRYIELLVAALARDTDNKELLQQVMRLESNLSVSNEKARQTNLDKILRIVIEMGGSNLFETIDEIGTSFDEPPESYRELKGMFVRKIIEEIEEKDEKEREEIIQKKIGRVENLFGSNMSRISKQERIMLNVAEVIAKCYPEFHEFGYRGEWATVYDQIFLRKIREAYDLLKKYVVKGDVAVLVPYCKIVSYIDRYTWSEENIKIDLGMHEFKKPEDVLSELKVETISEEELLVITELLKDEDQDTRELALIALGGIGDRRAVPAILEMIERYGVGYDDYEYLESLIKLDAIEELIEYYKNNDGIDIPYIISNMEEEYNEQVIERVIDILKNDEDILIKFLIDLHGYTGGWNIVEQRLNENNYLENFLRKNLDQRDTEVRYLAAIFLSKIGHKDVFSIIIEALRSNDATTRRSAISRLDDLRDARAVEPLIEVLQDEDQDIRKYVINVLRKFGDKRAVEPLIQLLKDENKDVRHSAIQVLGYLGDPRAIEPLINVMKDDDKGVIYAAIENLGKLQDPRTLEPLIEVLQDEDQDIRKLVINILEEIGDSRAVEPLIQLLKDENEEVRCATVEVLGKLRDSRAIEPLSQLLQDENQDVRVQVINILGEFENRKAIDPLIECYNDKRHDDRRNIILSLGRLAERKHIGFIFDKLNISEEDLDLFESVLETVENQRVQNFVIALLNISGKWKLAREEAGEEKEPIFEVLLEQLKNEDNNVRRSAASALYSLGDKRAIKPIKEAIQREKSVIVKSSLQYFLDKFEEEP